MKKERRTSLKGYLLTCILKGKLKPGIERNQTSSFGYPRQELMDNFLYTLVMECISSFVASLAILILGKESLIGLSVNSQREGKTEFDSPTATTRI